MSGRNDGATAPDASGLEEAGPPQLKDRDNGAHRNAGDRVLEKARGDLLAAIDSGAISLRRPDSSLTQGSRQSRLSESGSINSTNSHFSSRFSYASSIFSQRSSRISRRSSRSSRASSTLELLSSRDKSDAAADASEPSPRRAPAVSYWCTSCSELFTNKEEWKQHEQHGHSNHNMLMCPKPNCCRVFWDIPTFKEHHESYHFCKECPHSNTHIEQLGKIKHWACGFCSTVYHSRDIQLEHVATHFARGNTLSDWSHSNVIRGLLQQPQVHKYSSQQTKEFWDERIWGQDSTGRLELFMQYDRRGNLQDSLEHFSGTDEDAKELVFLSIDISGREIPRLGLSGTLQKYRSLALPLLPSSRLLSEIAGSSVPRTSSSSDGVSSLSSTEIESSPPPSSKMSLKLSETFPLSTSKTEIPSPSLGTTSGSDPISLLPAIKSEASSLDSRTLRRGSATSGTLSTAPVNFSFPDAYKRRSSTASESSRNSAGRLKHKRNKQQLLREIIVVDHEANNAAFGMKREEKEAGNFSNSVTNSRQKNQVRASTIEIEPPNLYSSHFSDKSDSETESDSQPETDSDDVLSLDDDELVESSRRAMVTQVRDDSLEAMIDRVMEKFWATWNQEWGGSIRKHTEGSIPTEGAGRSVGSGANGSNNNNALGGMPPQKGKRRRSDNGSGNDDNERSGQPSGVPPAKSASANGRKFACPFRKHDPITYSLSARRVCAVSGWNNTARLKEHLYRCHRSIFCERCHAVFKDDDELKAHLRGAKACEVDNGPPPEGLNKDQLEQLRSRKRLARVRSEEDKWYNIYGLLFPTEKEFPLPYFEPIEDVGRISPESRDLEQFEGYLRRQVPLLVRRGLMEAARLEMNPIEDHLFRILDQVYQDSFDLASRRFREGRGDDSSISAALSAEPSRPEDTAAANERRAESMATPEIEVIGEGTTEATEGPLSLIGDINSDPPISVDQMWQDFDLEGFFDFESTAVADLSDSGYAYGLSVCNCQAEPCSCGPVSVCRDPP